MKERFSSYVATMRKARGLTQRELGERLGFTPQGISRFESIDSGFDLSLLVPLLKTLDLSLEDVNERKKEGTHYQEIDIDLASIPDKIKSLRQEKGLSQEALGERIGSTGRSIRSYESGDSLPSFQALERIAEACEVSIFSLLLIAASSPSESPLAVMLEEGNPPKPSIIAPRPAPFWKSRRFLLFTLSALFVISVAVVTPFIVHSLSHEKENGFGRESSSSSLSSSSESSSSSAKPSPNYLDAQASQMEFHAIGESVEVTLLDPDGIFLLDEMKKEDCTLSTASGWEDLELSIEALDLGKFQVTLLGGFSGGFAFLDASIQDTLYPSILYLRYVSGEEMTIQGTDVTFTDGVFVEAANGRSESTLILSHSLSITGREYLYRHGEPVDVHGLDLGLMYGSIAMPSGIVDSRVVEAEGMAENGYRFSFYREPTQDRCVAYCAIKVEGDVERWFTFAPWVIHLVK